METCDPVGTPMEIKDKLDLDQNGTIVDATKYCSMIGALMYLTSSISDIIHATCLCARYQAKPTEKHLKEVISEEPLIWVSSIRRILTDYQLADLFTKALLVDRFNYLVRRLGMRSLSSQELERLTKSRQAQLVDTDTESDPEEAPSEVEELTDSSCSSASSDSTSPLSLDHLLTHVSPTPTPTRVSFYHRTTRMAVCTQLILSPGMSARIAEAAALSPSSFYKRNFKLFKKEGRLKNNLADGHSQGAYENISWNDDAKNLEALRTSNLSQNEKLQFSANENIYEKDEKLKRYRRIGMKAVKEKEQLQKTLDSWKDSSKNLWRLINSGMSSNKDSIGKPLYSRFTKTNDFKGVPPASLNAGSIGTSSEHSVDPESEISSVPPEVVNVSHLITLNKKGNWGSAVKTSAGYNWRNSNPNSNYDSGPTFIKIMNAKGPQGRPKPEGMGPLRETNFSLFQVQDHPLKNMVDSGIFASGCYRAHDKDETSGILQNFFRQIENQLNHRVKIIRSDNGIEFKNRDMLEFCRNKGIKQEYSNARTPQQNEVAERMNMTLIEAARTMLADSLLPTTFWAEAVSTACYIFIGVLGKFDGKSDEGFLVGYSLNSKAYRVYNLVTKRVEVNLHVNFLEDKPNVKGVGYRWMFDIDYLTDSMNYIPVSLENQANPHAGASEVTNSAGTSQTPSSNASEEKDEDVELIVVPSTMRNTEEKAESRKSSTNSKKEEILTELQQEKKASSTDTSEDNPKILAFRRELEEIALKHLGKVSENTTTSTPSVNTGSEPVNTGSFDPDDSPMPELEIFHKSETGIFDEASYDEEGVITDFNSLPTEIEVSPTPTLRIHRDNNIHPQSQLLGVLSSYYTYEEEKQGNVRRCLFQLVPQLMTMIESLEKDPSRLSDFIGNAIVKLARKGKKVKKLEKVVKSRRVVLTDSEDEAAKNSSKQGRNLQKDESEVFETPKQGKSLGETDISPQDIKSASEKVSSGGKHVSASQREGKAVLEETPQTKRTKKQIREEQASLAEIARIQAKEEAENARREELKRQDELAAKRLQEELELFEAQKEKIGQRRKLIAKQKAKAQRDKPITQAQQRQYMNNYLKNRGGWKLAQIKKLIDEELKEKFEYLMRGMERFVPMDTEKESRKRTGVELQIKSSKKLNSDIREDVSVLKEGLQEEQKPESAKSGTEEDVVDLHGGKCGLYITSISGRVSPMRVLEFAKLCFEKKRLEIGKDRHPQEAYNEDTQQKLKITCEVQGLGRNCKALLYNRNLCLKGYDFPFTRPGKGYTFSFHTLESPLGVSSGVIKEPYGTKFSMRLK
ncbi:putative ribonuclease H-like domain-containing protein [Tanacetum coccineum]